MMTPEERLTHAELRSIARELRHGDDSAARAHLPAGQPIGQIKQARNFRQFLLRGIDKVKGEWAMICTAHNLAKLTA